MKKTCRDCHFLTKRRIINRDEDELRVWSPFQRETWEQEIDSTIKFNEDRLAKFTDEKKEIDDIFPIFIPKCAQGLWEGMHLGHPSQAFNKHLVNKSRNKCRGFIEFDPLMGDDIEEAKKEQERKMSEHRYHNTLYIIFGTTILTMILSIATSFIGAIVQLAAGK